MDLSTGSCPAYSWTPSAYEAGQNYWGTPGSSLQLLGTTALLASFFNEVPIADGVLSAISFGSSWRWYLKMTQFESLFVMFIILEIMIGRYLGYFPFSMHDFFNGQATGKKRKRSTGPSFSGLSDELVEGVLKMLKKFDEEKCFPKSLCVMESKKAKGDRVPAGVKRFLTSLRQVSLHLLPEVDMKYLETSSEDVEEPKELKIRRHLNGLTTYIEAIDLGESSIQQTSNSSLCHKKYEACALSDSDILYYYDTISIAGLGFKK